MNNISNAHYFLLPSQGNIYTLTKLPLVSGINKVLVASLKRKIFSFEYTENPDGFLQSNLKEIAFTYIPSGAEIISIDAFNKSKIYDDFCIGITIIKPNASLSEPANLISETYLNIYTEQDLEANTKFNLENIAQNCLMVELNFIPYQLYHAEVVHCYQNSSSCEIVWLVSGSDFRIHVFREDQQNHTYYEAEATEIFPEFKVMPSVIQWFSLEYIHDKSRRLTAIGCECGYIQLTVVDVPTGSVINTWSDIQAGSVSRVVVFKHHSSFIKPPKQIEKFRELKENLVKNGLSEIHLLAVNGLQSSAVYMDVLNNGLSKKLELPESDQHDAALCGTVADLDFDGQLEVVIGTYAETILMYKFFEERWVLSGQYKLSNPIHGLEYLDVTGDGVKEIIVLTLAGVHILQHNPKETCNILISRLKKLMGKEENIEHVKKDEDSEKCSPPSQCENPIACLDSEEFTCEEVLETTQEQSETTLESGNAEI